ncbi:hypothetical protein KOXY103107_14555 [Komagataeibacter xylinus]
MRHLGMAGLTRGLEDRFLVGFDVHPGQAVEQHVDRLLGRAFAVGILDAEHELPAVVAGIEEIEKGGTGVADMQQAGGAGSKTRTDSHEPGS